MITTHAPQIACLVALAATSACVGNVGGGDSGRGRGSNTEPTPTSCDENVEEITEAITIRSNADFDKLPDGCWDLFAPLTIQGSEISSLAKLGNLNGVDELHLVGTSITAIDTMKPLKAFGAVTITNNDKLVDLKNLTVEWVDNIAMEITVDDNALLVSLDGLGDVPRADGNIVVTGNPKLAAAKFPKLTRADGSITVTNNAALASVELAALTSVGRLEVTSNPVMTTLSGLGATAIHGDMIVRGNKALTTMGSMSSLSRIEGSLVIDDNDALQNISAFTASLQYVTGALSVTNTGALTSLGQLSHLSGIGASVTITDNTNLSFCLAQEVDHCVGSHGNVTIQNNKSASNCDCWCGR